MKIFFDLDDTLLDGQAAVHAAVRDLHRDLGVDRPLAQFFDDWSSAHTRHYPRFLEGALSFEELGRLRIRDTVGGPLNDAAADAIFGRFMNAYERHWALFPDVEPVLDALAGSCLGVISNGPSRTQRHKLERLGLARRFRHVLISEECGFAKPAPQIFQRACELAGCPPADMVFVGDNYEIDVCGAIGAGMRAIWLRRRSESGLLSGAGAINSLDELEQVLRDG